MFNMTLFVFDEPDENPEWGIDDEEAIAILDIEQTLKYTPSNYDEVDSFIDELPFGYEGFSITDEETGKYWRIKGSDVFIYDGAGVRRANDENCVLESFLRELVKKRDYMWFALSEPTKYVAPPAD